MSDSTSNHHAFEALLKRLSIALDELEGALERQREVECAREGLIKELVLLRHERHNLASQLETAQARCQRLEQARDEILIRLENASQMIKTVLSNDLCQDEASKA